MIYYTADLHLGHANIIRSCQRPFSSAEEMDRMLLQNWNDRVGPEDTVYILGDLLFRSKTPADAYLEQLAGRKHLIIGNHDKSWMKKAALDRHFESVQYMAEIRDNGRRITLCHYPMMSWNHIREGGYLIFGHIHNNTKDFYWPLLARMDHALNAGVDVNGFVPVPFEELAANNEAYRHACLASTREYPC